MEKAVISISRVEDRVDKDCVEHIVKKEEKQIDILHCMVCTKKTVNAHMCPNCSKMGC